MANEGQTSREPVAVPEFVYPYQSGIIGGLIAGTAMALVGVITAPLIERSIWFPLNLVAASALPLAEASLDSFMLDAFVAGLVIHAVVSVGIGLLLALLLPTLPGSPIIWSLIIGPIMWFVAQFLALPILNPMMSQYVNRVSFVVAHVFYSVILGWWISRSEKVQVGQRGP